jgi:hypothetical protein
MILPALEQSLERWLRAELPLPAESGDVSFETPNGTWGSAVSRPTVNLFLHEVQPGTRPHAVLQARADRDGVLVETPPAPRVSFSYLVSAWAGGVRDEHLLLGDVLRVILSHTSLPTDLLAPGLVGPVEVLLGDGAVNRVKDVWGGIDGKLRASLLLVATTPVPVGRPVPVAPEVVGVEGVVGRRIAPPAITRRGTVRGAVEEAPRPRQVRAGDRVGWTQPETAAATEG